MTFDKNYKHLNTVYLSHNNFVCKKGFFFVQLSCLTGNISTGDLMKSSNGNASAICLASSLGVVVVLLLSRSATLTLSLASEKKGKKCG